MKWLFITNLQLTGFSFETTVCFTDFGKLNLLIVVLFEATTQVASQNGAHFKSGQHWIKNNRHLSISVKITVKPSSDEQFLQAILIKW